LANLSGRRRDAQRRFHQRRSGGHPKQSGRTRKIVASASADERSLRILWRCGRAAGSVAAVCGITLSSSTRLEDPPDDDKDREQVRERHDQVEHHDLMLPGPSSRKTTSRFRRFRASASLSRADRLPLSELERMGMC
jgi:hypothetical protein